MQCILLWFLAISQFLGSWGIYMYVSKPEKKDNPLDPLVWGTLFMNMFGLASLNEWKEVLPHLNLVVIKFHSFLLPCYFIELWVTSTRQIIAYSKSYRLEHGRSHISVMALPLPSPAEVSALRMNKILAQECNCLAH